MQGQIFKTSIGPFREPGRPAGSENTLTDHARYGPDRAGPELLFFFEANQAGLVIGAIGITGQKPVTGGGNPPGRRNSPQTAPFGKGLFLKIMGEEREFGQILPRREIEELRGYPEDGW